MATNIQLITASLRLLGVIPEGIAASAEQGDTALGFLNRMIEGWTENGTDLGWYEQTSTTDDAPLPKWAEKGVIAKLAQELRAVYPSSTLDASILDDNRNGYEIIARRTLLDQLEAADMSHMPVGSGNYGTGWDINNG